MRRWLRLIALTLLVVASLIATPLAQPINTQIAIAINRLTTGVTTFTLLRSNSGAYHLWGSGSTTTGYGFRDNAGVMEFKNLGGSWSAFGSGGGGGAPSDASYWVRVATGGLSNETVMAALGTGLVKNTTATGVPSIAVAADVISLWSGTCNAGTVLAGNGACVTGTGAPTTSTYITQTPDGTLSNEQALSTLITGILKSTTVTGVVSIATSSDIISLWTGTCNAGTVLAGDGSCVAVSGGGAPATASYWVRTADGTLSNETVMGNLGTGLVKNTATTGIPSIAVVSDVLALFTGTCNVGTVLSGGGTCVSPTSGAPTTATYITQVPDAGLSAEQALSTLATGLMKVTTTTGVISAASVNDILGYFTGTCDASTVLAGNGTCVAQATGGAPTNATYLTQTPNATLTNEQALSLLATGLMKVTTTTGVVSAASVSDILGYFSGSCSASTVLTGAGTCVGLSAAFSVITSGTNTTAAMVVGSGASLTATGTGTITATSLAVTGITGLGTGVATWLATPTSANLRAALTDETGTGVAVFNASPTFTGTVTSPSFTVSSGAQLLISTAAFTDGAGADTGTLTNAPAAGNPTKWIPINDNGTTRYIPAW